MSFQPVSQQIPLAYPINVAPVAAQQVQQLPAQPVQAAGQQGQVVIQIQEAPQARAAQPQNANAANWNGRTVMQKNDKVITFLFLMTLAGTFMYDTCYDPNISGCNLAIKKAGADLANTGGICLGIILVLALCLWATDRNPRAN